ncbi:hypothetical protein PF008_g21198 [Phytophthora fragariae]|uniref:Uncharacterized protein n=1 Tax=Phytophthora fragariae TaxID=53985 RepID=A0A6G0QXJ3_9STRA|nr:hypothetical protein PF008_g21198 [Phytophthora fragariae]
MIMALTASQSSDSSLSSSSDAGISIPTPAPTSSAVYTKASENVCMWTQQSSDACDSPRSCYDCLNTSPGDGVQCVISSAGLCTTMAHDSVCAACAGDQFVKSASGTTDPSQFCVGAGGCVCVGFCESPVYKTKVSNAYCATLSATTTVSVMGVSVDDIITIVILCFAIPVLAYLWWVRRLHKRRQAREEAYRNRPPVNGPLLPLVGWKKYCADLMANETAIVGVAGAGEAVATPAAATDNAANNVAAPLTNLQVATLTIELEDPQHPLTAVTSTGRRRSSVDNTNVVRPRPSQPVSIDESEEDEEGEMDARSTPYAQLGNRTA